MLSPGKMRVLRVGRNCCKLGGVKSLSLGGTGSGWEMRDAPSTVVFKRAKSGSASLNARISVGQTKVKSLRRKYQKYSWQEVLK